MTVDSVIISEACSLLGVSDDGHIKDGGQKTVRAASRGDEEFVLKVIQLGGTSPQALLRASREVDLLQSLDNDHVVRVASDLVEIGEPPKGVAWLEERLDGEDLGDCVGAGWDWGEASEMGKQVGRGLGAMHSMRVVHRDLSAGNVRRTDAGVFKILDPGCARYELLPPVTIGGHPGTPGFMSPEHLRPPPAGPTRFSDVFCLGSLMWMTLTGEPAVPYWGDLSDYVQRLQKVELTRSDALRQRLDGDQFALLMRCLHRQPARRYRDGNELADALEAL